MSFLCFAFLCLLSIGTTATLAFLHGSFEDPGAFFGWLMNFSQSRKGPFWNGLWLLLMLVHTFLPVSEIWKKKKVGTAQLVLLTLGILVVAAEIWWLCSPMASSLSSINALK